MSGISFQCLQFQPFFMQPVQIRSGRTGTEVFENLFYDPGQPGIHFKDVGHRTFPTAGTARSLWISRSVHGYPTEYPSRSSGTSRSTPRFRCVSAGRFQKGHSWLSWFNRLLFLAAFLRLASCLTASCKLPSSSSVSF